MIERYRRDREWSDLFIPAIQDILGQGAVPASPFADMKQASDLILLNAGNKAIAARVRSYEHARVYPHEFTIRSHLDNGARTEHSKIMAGFGDMMIYGFSNKFEDGSGFCQRVTIDLDLFRDSGVEGELKSNGDGTYFYAYDLRSFSPGIAVDTWADAEQRELLRNCFNIEFKMF